MMLRRARAGLLLLAALLPTAVRADDDDLEQVWSATLMTEFQVISGPWANDGRGDFFDQYQWVPNKSSVLPVELGVRDAMWDVFGPGDTPIVQMRFSSPTSNLGVSGSQVDQPFLNQRADLLGRFHAFDLDLRYWRYRTEEMRLFPNTEGLIPYVDLTGPDDRFTHDRTGFDGELRVRVSDLMGDASANAEEDEDEDGDEEAAEKPKIPFDPQLAVRGGYDWRPGSTQLRFLLQPVNQWTGVTRDVDEDVSKVGGGVLIVPGGLLTMTMDADYKRFRSTPTLFQGEIAPSVPPATRVIGFVPDTDQIVGTIRLQGQLGERLALESGFQIKRLEQVEVLTPAQQALGLTNNDLLFYSANLASSIDISKRWSGTARLKFDQRNNRIDRDTPLFQPNNGTQVDEFLQKFNRIDMDAELAFEPVLRNLFAVGVRYQWIDRDLVFASPFGPNPAILEPNALLSHKTEMWTVYGRTRLRPWRTLSLTGEVGYRGAPQTAYAADLDDYVYGNLKGSYVFSLSKPIILSAFAQGSRGENEQFTMVDGVGPVPAGAQTGLSFERVDYGWGINVSTTPWRKLSVFASFSCSTDDQDYALVLSDLQRYYQPLVPINFAQQGNPSYRNRQRSLIVGVHTPLWKSSDVGVSYAYTGAEARYESSASSPAADIVATSVVDAKIHRLQAEAGHWVRDGLRVLVGYRLQLLNDDAPVLASPGSVVPPISPSVTQHTITLGVTLTSDLLKRNDG